MSRLRAEEGWAMVTAIAVMAIAMALGTASLAMLDGQQKHTQLQRTSESSFQLAEGALNAQIHLLTQKWRGTGPAGQQFVCTSTSTDPGCPDPAALRAQFLNQDIDAGATWQTSIHDNVTPSANYYDDASRTANESYDAGKDKRLWVRSQATVHGRTRTLVALVRVDTVAEPLPQAALLSGSLDITNKGNKVIIDAKVSEGATQGSVGVRCDPAADPNARCLAHPMNDPQRERLLSTQISGTQPITSYAGNTLSAESLARLERTAIADGTHYATCPADVSGLAGKVVWIESGNCAYNANATINSEQSPGALFMESGTLTLAGTLSYHGIVYHLNTQAATGPLVTIQGNAQVVGGVFVDGAGAVQVGSSGGSSRANIKINPRAHAGLSSNGTAGIIQNTWREIRPTS